MLTAAIMAAAALLSPHQQHLQHCRHTPAACSTAPAATGLAPLPVRTLLREPQADLWSAAALRALGAPVTTANLRTMFDWYQNEGIPHDLNNPLNLKTPHGGSVASNADGDPISIGIQAYPSPADFVAAFAIQIRTGGVDGPNDNGPYLYILDDLLAGRGMEGDRSAGLAHDLSVYSGGGYSTIPAAYCPCS